VRIGADRVVVTAWDGSSAVIERSPFNLRFRNP
jgi:hypothetical protein